MKAIGTFIVSGVLCSSMHEPTISALTGWGPSVLVAGDDGVAIGRYTGESRPESESYEVKVIDPMTGDEDYTSFFHKEDIWKNTEENWERLKDNL